MAVLPVLPVLLAIALACLSYGVRNFKWGSALMVVGSGLQVILASFLVYWTVSHEQVLQTSLGGWSAPFGISFYLDSFSSLMIWISSFIFFAVHLYSLAGPEAEQRFWAHNICWNTLAAGVFGAFSTNDLFNLFVWFEVLLFSSYVLFTWSFADENASRETRVHGRKGLITYMVLNVLGSSIFLLGLGMLYSATGTLNFSDLMRLTINEVSPAMQLSGFCLLFAFALKAGLFPLFNWLPASYPFGPVSSVALFAGLLTKVGIYALVRFFLPTSPLSADWVFTAVLISANITMLVGVYGAATKNSLRMILSFHIVSQVGYMALGFAIGTATALSATIFYFLHHMVVKTNLFLIAGAIIKIRGTDELKNLGGLFKTNPWLASAFAVSALSLAGLPPFSGFWAKFFILYSAAESAHYVSLGVGLFVGLFTVFSMLKIWSKGFLKPATIFTRVKIPLPYICAILILTLWTIGLGLFPHILTNISDFAATQLLDPKNYLNTLQGLPK